MKKRIQNLEKLIKKNRNAAEVDIQIHIINHKLKEMVIIPKWWLIFAGIAFGAGLIAMIGNFF